MASIFHCLEHRRRVVDVLIMPAAPICPYCDQPAALVRGKAIYPLSSKLARRWFWKCSGTCDAYVGTHKGTKNPLGTLSDARTRYLRHAAHEAFDPVWIRHANREKMRFEAARPYGYLWLSIQLGIDVEDCHIGLFDAATCERVIEICEKFHMEAKEVA